MGRTSDLHFRRLFPSRPRSRCWPWAEFRCCLDDCGELKCVKGVGARKGSGIFLDAPKKFLIPFQRRRVTWTRNITRPWHARWSLLCAVPIRKGGEKPKSPHGSPCAPGSICGTAGQYDNRTNTLRTETGILPPTIQSTGVHTENVIRGGDGTDGGDKREGQAPLVGKFLAISMSASCADCANQYRGCACSQVARQRHSPMLRPERKRRART